MTVVAGDPRQRTGRSRPATPPTRLPFRIGGLGAALPAARLTNADLARQVDTNDAWIVERTGIRERRVVGPGQATSDLAEAAAREALADARVGPEAIDSLVVTTCTPDQPLPSTAAFVARSLGVRCAAVDLVAACAGWVYGLVTAAGLLASGVNTTTLLIGAEVLTQWMDPGDRATLPLFGDGAAAAVLTAGDGPAADVPAGPGLVAWDLGIDAEGCDLLTVPAGGSRLPASADTLATGGHYMKMQGREVFRRAVRAVEASCSSVLRQAGVRPSDVALFVPHQANARIVDAIVPRLGLTPEQTVVNIELYGNTSAASIPLALCEATAAGRLADGDLVLLAGFGAGMTWGTALMRWGYSGSGPSSPRSLPA
ncbi:MAG TPA: beta-ketoacyl-ACP synthase III [Acidimicrobiia bacterium]|nr:beta-ketoacyl-ACP synthase III [Acidimicrobiia bacterium]